jgi:hypothetical protein
MLNSKNQRRKQKREAGLPASPDFPYSRPRDRALRYDLLAEDFRPDDFRCVDFRCVDLRPVDFLRVADLRLADFRDDDFRDEDFRDDDLRDEDLDVRLRGVFSPFSRASLMPIAIACLRLVTLRPPRVLSFPCLRRRIALPTVELAFLLYFLPDDLRVDLRPDDLCVDLRPEWDDLRAAM